MIGRLLSWFGIATALAGAVALARQRSEATAARHGVIERASAARDIGPIARYGPLAARLAIWVPEVPTTRVGRAATRVWAAPLTGIGLTAAWLSGGHPHWDAELGCFVTRGVHGASSFALRTVGADANAVGHVVLARGGEPGRALLAHEAVHVRQAERLGPLLFPLYVWLGARYGYRDHPLERAARLGARRALDAPPAPLD